MTWTVTNPDYFRELCRIQTTPTRRATHLEPLLARGEVREALLAAKVAGEERLGVEHLHARLGARPDADRPHHGGGVRDARVRAARTLPAVARWGQTRGALGGFEKRGLSRRGFRKLRSYRPDMLAGAESGCDLLLLRLSSSTCSDR